MKLTDRRSTCRSFLAGNPPDDGSERDSAAAACSSAVVYECMCCDPEPDPDADDGTLADWAANGVAENDEADDDPAGGGGPNSPASGRRPSPSYAELTSPPDPVDIDQSERVRVG